MTKKKKEQCKIIIDESKVNYIKMQKSFLELTENRIGLLHNLFNLIIPLEMKWTYNEVEIYCWSESFEPTIPGERKYYGICIECNYQHRYNKALKTYDLTLQRI